MIHRDPDRSTDAGSLSALTFLGDVRSEFQLRNQKLVGDIKRDLDRDQAISLFVKTYFSGQNPAGGLVGASERLLHRFEVLCARVGRSLATADQREPVYRILLEQLTENVQRLGMRPGILVTATLLNDFPLSSIQEDAALSGLLHDRRYLLKRALESSPARPREFLFEGVARMSELNRYLDETGEIMHQQTRVKLAFLCRAKSIDDLMNDRRKAIDTLLNEPEFKMLLANRKWLAVYSVDQFKEDLVRPRLRQIHLCLARVLANDDFAELRKRPADIIIAAISHPHDTEKFLTEVLEREARLKPLMRDLSIVMPDKELRLLCLKTPRRAGIYEQQLRQRQVSREAHSGGAS